MVTCTGTVHVYLTKHPDIVDIGVLGVLGPNPKITISAKSVTFRPFLWIFSNPLHKWACDPFRPLFTPLLRGCTGVESPVGVVPCNGTNTLEGLS